MSILSTNHRLISIGESYSAGNGIDITDQVISVTGDATPYSAGENIDIQDHIISGKDWSQDITDASSNAFNETTAWVQENYANSADMTYISAVVDTKLDASAWSTVSADYATEDYVIMADNITYNRATGYVDAQQFAKESACQSAFDYLNTNKLNTEDFTAWQNGQYATDLQTIEGQIANKYDTSSFAEVSGDFQPRGDYVERDFVLSSIESATSGKLNVSSFASVSGDFLTTSFGISESATWNETSDVVQTNSAQWAQGGVSPSGFVSGSNVLFVPDEWIPGQGKVYSANISGDITVNYGQYYNSGEYINFYETYSLSSVGSQISQIDDKLNKSVIENSKTLSIIDDKAEVLSFGYRPSGFVTTGIEINNYSSPEMVNIVVRTPPYKLYSASLVIESDGFNEYFIRDGWNFVNSANGSATFSKFYKNEYSDTVLFPGFLDYNLTNASAYPVARSDELVMDAIAFKSDLTGQGGGSGDEEVNSFVYNNSATINEVNTAYQTHSASYQPSGNYIPYTGYSASLGYVTNSSFTIHNGSFTNTLGIGTIVIQNRISSNIYNNMAAGPASISFSTPSDSAKVDLPSINKWNDVSTTVQTNSAQWGQGGGSGDEEVNSFVYNNSATINNVDSIVQSNSATWANEFDPSYMSGAIDNKLDESAFADVSGTFLTAINIPKSASWEEATQAYEQNSASYVVENNFEYDGNDLITAYNGSAFAGQGGGDVPEDVMVESAIGYNAVGEISGYNGSALTDVNLNNIVQTNSGAWGGSALPISAGNGIGLSMVDGVLVISVTGGN